MAISTQPFQASSASMSAAVLALLDAAQEIRVYLVADSYTIGQETTHLSHIPEPARVTYGVVAGYTVNPDDDVALLEFTPFKGSTENPYPDAGGGPVGEQGTQFAIVLWQGNPATSRVLGWQQLDSVYVLDGTPDDLEWPQGVLKLTNVTE